MEFIIFFTLAMTGLICLAVYPFVYHIRLDNVSSFRKKVLSVSIELFKNLPSFEEMFWKKGNPFFPISWEMYLTSDEMKKFSKEIEKADKTFG